MVTTFPDYEKIVNALGVSFGLRRQARLDLDLCNREMPPTKPSIEVPPKLELKALPSHLKYAILVVLYGCQPTDSSVARAPM